jgi:hypothetical protein
MYPASYFKVYIHIVYYLHFTNQRMRSVICNKIQIIKYNS